MEDLIVPVEAKGKRLDVHLREVLPDFSRSHLQREIESGGILLDGRRVSVHRFLRGGETISFVARAEGAAPAAAAPVAIPVMAVEPDYLVVDKPAGLAVHPGPGVKPPTLADSLLVAHPEIAGLGEPDRPGIVHRLDKDVSGLMIVARTERGFRFFKQAFSERRIEKTYLALVWGRFEQESGTIERPIARSARRPRMAARSPGQAGKEAVTHWSVLRRFRNATLLEVKIETGRTHQIRAHLFAIGHPLLGDPLYKNARLKIRPAPPRLCLHAAELGFKDPTGAQRRFESPLPKELAEYLDTLSK
jgi:23S rRNA pseudouridine1911/1915/1917 synthase